MKDLVKYYSLTLAFYSVEIAIFKSAYGLWVYDVFWLNMLIRIILVSFFSIIVRNTIFKDSRFFYIKISGLILISPLISSSLLKIFTIMYPMVWILILKVISDLVSSLLVFFMLKKIA